MTVLSFDASRMVQAFLQVPKTFAIDHSLPFLQKRNLCITHAPLVALSGFAYGSRQGHGVANTAASKVKRFRRRDTPRSNV